MSVAMLHSATAVRSKNIKLQQDTDGSQKVYLVPPEWWRGEEVLTELSCEALQDGKGGLGPSDGWPVLSTEDMLAGLHATVPYIITTYSGGASCDGSDAAPKRSAKVRAQALRYRFHPVCLLRSRPVTP